VLDVYREAGDFADASERSFSNSSRVVGTCGSAFMAREVLSGRDDTGRLLRADKCRPACSNDAG
jgi:hypothetical protein